MSNNIEKQNMSPRKSRAFSITLKIVLPVLIAVALLLLVIFNPILTDYLNRTSSLVTPTDATVTDATLTDTYSIEEPLSVEPSIAIESSVVESSQAVSSKAVESKVASKPKPKPVSSAPAVTQQNPDSIVKYTERQSYAQLGTLTEALCEKYSELLTVSTYGTSVQGRNLYLMKLGKGERNALIVAGIHGREHITTTYTLRCIEEYCTAYNEEKKIGNYDVKTLLDTYTLFVVPNCNPDGSEITAGRASPNVTVNKFDRDEYKANANGINLNKNFPFYFDQLDTKVYTPDNVEYKGTTAASEPETQALMQLCAENNFYFMLSFHVKGDCTYWSDAITPNAGGISQSLAAAYYKTFDLYNAPTTVKPTGYGGGFENWFRYTYQRPGICVELMPLTKTVYGATSSNQKYFDSTVRWSNTKGIWAFTMWYLG